MNEPAIIKLPQAWPATVEAMLARQKNGQQRTFLEYVRDIHAQLWPDPQYQRYLMGTDDDEAVEGDLDIDDSKAAEMIRNYAKEHKIPIVPEQTLHAIRKKLRVVLRRFELSRKDLREVLREEPA